MSQFPQTRNCTPLTLLWLLVRCNSYVSLTTNIYTPSLGRNLYSGLHSQTKTRPKPAVIFFHWASVLPYSSLHYFLHNLLTFIISHYLSNSNIYPVLPISSTSLFWNNYFPFSRIQFIFLTTSSSDGLYTRLTF